MISFLEHFTADPSYRPTFRSRWYFSLIGAIACLFLMFRINAYYATLSLAIMGLIYWGFSRYNQKKDGLAHIFQGVIFQLSRELQVFLQKAEKSPEEERWRPSVICISGDSFRRFAAFDLLRWISHKYGFGTYIHFMEGYLSKEMHEETTRALKQLIKIAEYAKSNVYLDTIVSPSLRTAIAQVVQLPGVSGKENNMLLFEYSKQHPDNIEEIINNFQLIKSTDFDVCILGSSERNFGYNRSIHIWITSKDYENASLMILLAYILVGHPDWHDANIVLFAIYPEKEVDEQRQMLLELIQSGRLPISHSNVVIIPQKENKDVKSHINEHSAHADLTIVGVRGEAIKHDGIEVFNGYDNVGDILFVNTTKQKDLH